VKVDPTRFLALHREKSRLEEELGKLKDEIEEAEAELMNGMSENGLTTLKTTDGSSIRWSRMVRASSAGNVPAMIEAMRADGLDDMVGETVNGTRLGAWVREHDPKNRLSVEQIKEKLPPNVSKVISVTEKICLVPTLK
jgi:hypothetical protein